jgi:hypothetical protein
VLFSWRTEAVKSYFNCSTGAEPKNSWRKESRVPNP